MKACFSRSVSILVWFGVVCRCQVSGGLQVSGGGQVSGGVQVQVSGGV